MLNCRGRRTKGDFSRGTSLLEILVAGAMLSLLMTVLFAVFFQGTRAWRLADARTELHRNATKLIARFSREAQQSQYASLSLESHGLGFISAQDTGGVFQLGPDGRPSWQAYLLYYKDPDSVIKRRRVALPIPGSLPVPIEQFDFGAGPRPLSFYLDAGEPVARGVKVFDPKSPRHGLIQLSLELESDVQGRSGKTQWSVDTSVWMRN